MSTKQDNSSPNQANRSYEVRIAGTTDGGNRVPNLSPREAMERWLAKLKGAKSESTVASYHYQLKLFVEWCEEQNIASVSEINGWDLECYDTHRRNTGIKLVSLNKELGTLQNFLGYCANIELVDESLPEKVDPPGIPAGAEVNETRLNADRARSLFDYYRREEYGTRPHALLALLWFTGARQGAIRGLDLEDFNSEEEYIRFHHKPDRGLPLKNGYDGERAVGVPSKVCDILDAYIRDHRARVHDDHSYPPLLASQVGRPARDTIRSWTYLATEPCLHRECPHGHQRSTCEYTQHSKSSQCPSSRAPHQVRTGSITWQLNRGVPIEAVAERVNTSARTLKRHYDQPTPLEALEERRRKHIGQLSLDNGGDRE